MNFKLLLFIAVIFLAGTVSCQTNNGQDKNNRQNKEQKTDMEKVSYAIGKSIGQNFKVQGIEVTYEKLLQGIKDGFAGVEGEMTEAELTEVMTKFQQEMMAKQQEEQKVVGDKNKAEGDAFLAANKDKEGVVTTPSGLQYKVIKEGTGEKPTADDKVTVHYEGTLIDGTKFDSSYDRGETIEFACTGVIKGWTEALQLMPVGSTYQLFIPSDLAYGERGTQGGPIGPNAALIFKVELIGIAK